MRSSLGDRASDCNVDIAIGKVELVIDADENKQEIVGNFYYCYICKKVLILIIHVN
jgi:hypothetical protein